MCRRCSIGGHECVYPRSVEVQIQSHTESLDVQRQPTDDDLLAHSSDAEDFIQSAFPTTTDTEDLSFELLEYGADDSTAQQFQTTFVNIQIPKKVPVSSTIYFPTNIYYGFDASPMLHNLPCLYKKPDLVHDDLMPFFLSYHRRHIDYGRYFWYSDYHRFIKESLLDLAKQSDSLQYAIAAFSALIYSIQVNHHVKQYTFHFYTKAIQGVQQVINTKSIESESSLYTTVATILELASVEAHPRTKGLMIAGYCGRGQMFSACTRRGHALSNVY